MCLRSVVGAGLGTFEQKAESPSLVDCWHSSQGVLSGRYSAWVGARFFGKVDDWLCFWSSRAWGDDVPVHVTKPTEGPRPFVLPQNGKYHGSVSLDAVWHLSQPNSRVLSNMHASSICLLCIVDEKDVREEGVVA